MSRSKNCILILILIGGISAPFASIGQTTPIEGIGKPLCKYLQAVDFTEQASVGQWLLGYYSGALAMNISFSLAQGQSTDVLERAEKWDQKSLLESARAFCANHPDKPLHRVANMVVTLVLDN